MSNFFDLEARAKGMSLSDLTDGQRDYAAALVDGEARVKALRDSDKREDRKHARVLGPLLVDAYARIARHHGLSEDDAIIAEIVARR